MIDEEFESGGCIYRITSSSAVALVSCSINVKNYEVPDVVDFKGVSYRITKIVKSAFEGSKIKHLSFHPNSHLEEIENSAFLFTNFHTVTLPVSYRVTHRGSHITEATLTIRDKIGRYFIESEDGAIYRKNPFIYVRGERRRMSRCYIIRESVTQIFHYSFFFHPSITVVTIPQSVTSIGRYAFYECANLTRVYFSEFSKLEVIDVNAFSSNKIKNICFPASLKFINSSAFESCKLMNVSFSDDSKLEFIGYRAFYGNPFEIFDFPESLLKIEALAFAMCSKLKRITFPLTSKVEKIAQFTFYKTAIRSVQCSPEVLEMLKKTAPTDNNDAAQL